MRARSSRILLVGLLGIASLLAWSPEVDAARRRTQADVTVTSSVTTVLAASEGRVGAACTNTSATVHVRWGDTNSTATRGAQLRATATLTLSGADATAALSMISEGANVSVSCTETLE